MAQSKWSVSPALDSKALSDVLDFYLITTILIVNMIDILFISLGAIIGLLIAAITVATAVTFQTPIIRKIKQMTSAASLKGSILEPEDEELTGWVDNLPTE